MAYTSEDDSTTGGNFNSTDPSLFNLTPEEQSLGLEQLLDLIADKLILSSYVDTTDVTDSQKFIRNGQLEQGAGAGVLALFQKDIKANQEDLNQTTIINQGTEEEQVIPKLQEIANRITNFDTLLISINPNEGGISIEHSDGGLVAPEPITDLIVQDGNPLNVSQFIPLTDQKTIVDVELAEEFLDTNIYELLPSGDARQARITRFFQELNALLPPNEPDFDLDNNGEVDREPNRTWSGATEYNQDNSISYAQDNQDGNIDEEEAFIHRLKNTANDVNSTKTIEDIYNTILPYLTDLLENQVELQEMAKYENKSSGYLKFRNLNQGIIIRNQNSDFIDSLNPDNPTWLTNDYVGLGGSYSEDISPFDTTTQFILDKAGTGFTITMWVKFLDKTSSGTLFNYGNPTRAENPFGFKLETYVVNKDDPTVVISNENTAYNNFGQLVDENAYLNNTLGLFKNTTSERFVRLQVREFGKNNTAQDYDRGLRSSEIGNPTLPKYTWNAPELNPISPGYGDRMLLNNTIIPENFNEWYFICASYNPSIIEPNIFDSDTTDDFNPNADDYNVVNGYTLSPASGRDAGHEPLFWMNHINPLNGTIVSNSGYGNKCKVEIISRSDLLRARGLNV